MKSAGVNKLTAEYKEKIKKRNPRDLIFIDEFGAGQNLTREYGRSPKGRRVCGECPVSGGKRISTIGGLSAEGIETAVCFEGTLTGNVFLYFIENFLRERLGPGQLVIMDNATAHKVTGAEEAIKKTGAELMYLPPYSPHLNPIEHAWSKIKAYLRKAKARSGESLYQAIAEGLALISDRDAKGWFEHAGYTLSNP